MSSRTLPSLMIWDGPKRWGTCMGLLVPRRVSSSGDIGFSLLSRGLHLEQRAVLVRKVGVEVLDQVRPDRGVLWIVPEVIPLVRVVIVLIELTFRTFVEDIGLRHAEFRQWHEVGG